MTQGYKKAIKYWAIGMVWFYFLLWPLMGITPEGLKFADSLRVWGVVILGTGFCLILFLLKQNRKLEFIGRPMSAGAQKVRDFHDKVPTWASLTTIFLVACAVPFVADRYVLDVSINVLIYVCLGLGLNVVVGLCGLLDLGYIAFYGVGAYTYALLSVNYDMSFWLALPIAALFASIAGCIIGYPTLRMRGDYLAIVTLGFGEIVRIILNNWMSLTNGPNGVLGIKAPSIYWPDDPSGWQLIYLRQLPHLYYIILGLTIFTIVAVYRLNYSRIGRAWESIREDETAAELMGVNTFRFKLLAYAMGAVFGGLAGAFFAARMRFVSPGSFTFIESAMVLSMVVLGGLASIPGVVIGALALIALPEVFREFESFRMLAFGLAMTVMMIFRPKGIIPAARFGSRSEESK